MAYSDPREEAYKIVRDLMYDMRDMYDLGRASDRLIGIIGALIKERDYWQRECEGARRYRDMAPLPPMSASYEVTIDTADGPYSTSVPPGMELVYDPRQNVKYLRSWGSKQQDKKPDKSEPPATPSDPIKDRMSGLDFEEDK